MLKDVFLWFFLGAGSRLESVGEDDELTVENGESNYEIAVKYSRGGRKHSLPQQLESAGARQVSRKAELAVSTSQCSVLWHLPEGHRNGQGSWNRITQVHHGTETRPGHQTEELLWVLWRRVLLACGHKALRLFILGVAVLEIWRLKK